MLPYPYPGHAKPAPTNAMRELHLTTPNTGSASLKRSRADEEDNSTHPSKAFKATSTSTPASAAANNTKNNTNTNNANASSMQAVWDQTHISRCLARFADLRQEYANAHQTEKEGLWAKIVALREGLREAGVEVEVDGVTGEVGNR